MKTSNEVTLLGIDCVNIDRLKLTADICQKDFTPVKNSSPVFSRYYVVE